MLKVNSGNNVIYFNKPNTVDSVLLIISFVFCFTFLPGPSTLGQAFRSMDAACASSKKKRADENHAGLFSRKLEKESSIYLIMYLHAMVFLSHFLVRLHSVRNATLRLCIDGLYASNSLTYMYCPTPLMPTIIGAPLQWHRFEFILRGRNFYPHREGDEASAQRAEARDPKGRDRGVGFLGRRQRAASPSLLGKGAASPLPTSYGSGGAM